MTPEIEHFDTDTSKWHLAEYSRLISACRDNRKNNVSVAELCRRLDSQRTAIYRIENGDVDPKLTTLINYLHGFGYHLEIVPDSLEKTEETKEVKPDYNYEYDGIPFFIENINFNKRKIDSHMRVKILRYLLECYEDDLKNAKEQE